MKWTEGLIHVAMRRALKSQGWKLIAGEYPGGSDHELYPLNVVDPSIARDQSPDPRRHSFGELIPDLVAVRDSHILIAEAKVGYSASDQNKLEMLLSARRHHFLAALHKFALERKFQDLLPVEQFRLHPVLVFSATAPAPKPIDSFSYLRVVDRSQAFFEGPLFDIF